MPQLLWTLRAGSEVSMKTLDRRIAKLEERRRPRTIVFAPLEFRPLSSSSQERWSPENPKPKIVPTRPWQLSF